MSAAGRILAVLETGPRKRSVLDALVGDRRVLDELLKRGDVVMLGDKKGAVYGLPRPRRSALAAFARAGQS